MSLQPTILERIKQNQLSDQYLNRAKDEVESNKSKVFVLSIDGVITFQRRLCVPKIGDLREEILTEAHNTLYSVHPGTTEDV